MSSFQPRPQRPQWVRGTWTWSSLPSPSGPGFKCLSLPGLLWKSSVGPGSQAVVLTGRYPGTWTLRKHLLMLQKAPGTLLGTSRQSRELCRDSQASHLRPTDPIQPDQHSFIQLKKNLSWGQRSRGCQHRETESRNREPQTPNHLTMTSSVWFYLVQAHTFNGPLRTFLVNIRNYPVTG